MSAPFEPESLAELTRYIQYVVGGMEKQLANLSEQIGKLDVVSRTQYREDMAALRERHLEEIKDVRDDMSEIKHDFEQFQSRLSSHGRWLVGSVIFPLVGLILTIYALLKGVSL